ncbi:MAG: hypothetical protein DI603_09000 [Roseateles depolymerans]|uniref:Uncharacterized protein n=1 Tax=Roseateles depolymerans TaxID=76731 RepID=A0A2W5FP92_9BURK|nr:MAG: hypothetical protein DI603_09000 [Roseateles depolymerans]
MGDGVGHLSHSGTMSSELQDSIQTVGFLSAEMGQYRVAYRARYRAAFERFEAVSSTATTALFDLQIADLDFVQTIGVLFWMKCVAHCQGAFLMLENGMANQAQVLIRSAVEHLFFACAVLRDHTVVHRLAAVEDSQRRVQAQGMLRLSSLTPEQRQDLENFVGGLAAGGKGITAFDAAHIAGQEDLYQTVYRGLSLIAAHGTLSSVDSFLEVDELDDQHAQIRFGPSPQKIEWTLDLATTLLHRGLQQFEHLGPHQLPQPTSPRP